jgi:hypothetical protein
MKKKVVILYRNHGRDCKSFVDYTLTTENFERDMEVLRYLESGWEQHSYCMEPGPRRHMQVNTPVRILSVFFKYCIGESLFEWKSYEAYFKRGENNIDPIRGWEYVDFEEGKALFEKLNNKETFDYWRSILVAPHNSHANVVGDVYVISFSMEHEESYHCIYDQPSLTKEVMDERNVIRKRNRSLAFKDDLGESM